MEDFKVKRQQNDFLYQERIIMIATNNRIRCSWCKQTIRKNEEFTYCKFTNICSVCIEKFYLAMDKKKRKEAKTNRLVDIL